MAIGWLAVLQSVPWGDLISSAPKVADSAKKLWQNAGKKSFGPPFDATDVPHVLSSEAQTIKSLQQQLNEADLAIADLQSQMLASSELLRDLANQNTQLVKRMESIWVKLKIVSFVTVFLVAIVASSIILSVVR